MSSSGDFDAKTRRRRLGGTKPPPDAIARLAHADPARALVTISIGRLAADGFAELDMLDNGDVRLRFKTGETFLLTETGIVRLI
ncbi:MAG: hypothetical protein JOZ58_03155 [Acetobacteraceae bacterium]|nr:hypothetical protein [Acetobacteraceae bacterium]